MQSRIWVILSMALMLILSLAACSNPYGMPVGLTPVPTLAPAVAPTLIPVLQGPSQTNVSTTGGIGPADAALGVPIYLQHCSSCHGLRGEGYIGLPLRNSDYVQNAGDQAIYNTIANGRAGTKMPAWLQSNGGPLTEAQINNVIAYLRQLQKVQPLPTETPIPPEPTETPLPPNAPTLEPSHPSEPGGPRPAASMTGDASRGMALFGQYCAVCHGPEGTAGLPNPDSDDGAVPSLNPIDPSIANADPAKLAANLDVFIEHGSVPSGPSPLLMMPAFGDRKLLSDQQIADLIAYVISLNKVR